ncbi:MAG: DNA polymerase IV [Nitrospinota bacterium]
MAESLLSVYIGVVRAERRTKMGTRCILHVDLDAFYASVEQRDNPDLRGKPVIVGADPKGGKGRGVVAACSYEARKYGLHSAMPIGRAYGRCPQGSYLPVRMGRYAEVSGEIQKVFFDYTDLVEAISIDEAFLDVTASRRLLGDARQIALSIKDRIRKEQQLTASVGVAANKFIAKIASDLDKPDGLVEVPPGEELDFLAPLPISRLWGVGRKTEPKLRTLGVRTIGGLRDVPLETLKAKFGLLGEHLHDLAFGRDDREVLPESDPKSIGNETTFSQDVSDVAVLRKTLLALSEEVGSRLRAEGFRGRTVTLKFRYEDFTTHTRSHTLRGVTDLDAEVFETACTLLEDFLPLSGRQVRLLGVSVSNLGAASAPAQLSLFQRAPTQRSQRPSPETRRKAADAVDRLRKKFGWRAVTLGSLLEEDADEED